MTKLHRLFLTVRSSIFRRVHTNCLCDWCHLRPVKGTPEQIAAFVALIPPEL